MKIPIVNEEDEIIGEEERSVIHKQGLKHREIHVWLITPNKEFIFQKRGLHQDTWPGYLDVTVGGHVDTSVEGYQKCAERELFEETGINIPITFIMKKYSESHDPNTNTQNNAFRTTFAGLFDGNISDLKVEEGSGLGFKKFSLEEIENLTEEEKSEFIPRFASEDYKVVYKEIINKFFNKNETQN